MRLMASAIVMYWAEIMCEWSRQGGINADRQLLQTLANEADTQMIDLY